MSAGGETRDDRSEAVTDVAKAGGEAARTDDLARGTPVGRYTILESVGSGATGEVYAAYDPELDRRIALKLIDRWHRRGRREAPALARVAHPNVITIYDVGEHNGQLFLAMEFADGGTVAEWSATPRPWREAVDLFVRAGRGLEAVHRAGLVHRDFKPANILLFRRGDVCVSDFGLARAIDEVGEEDEGAPSPAAPTPPPHSALSDQLTYPGDVLGTPRYMAPEQRNGQVATAASDQFAFCVALFEAIYGGTPFPGKNREQVLKAMRGPPAFPARPAVPGWVRRTLARGLSFDPAARYPSMAALIADLTARRRRVWLAIFPVALAAALAPVVLRKPPDPCAPAPAPLAGTWDAGRRTEVRAALVATGVPYASAAADAVIARLDAWGDELVATERELCVATRVRHLQSTARLDAQSACLVERRREVATLADVLARADKRVAANAVAAAQAVEPPRGCIRTEVEAPARAPALASWSRVLLAEARALGHAGRSEDSMGRARLAAITAAAAGDERTSIRGATFLGEIVTRVEPKEAEPILENALWRGVAAGYDAEAVRAALALAILCNRVSRPADAHRWEHQAEALLHRAPDELARAELLSLTGNTARKDGHANEALPPVQEALAIRERLLPAGDLQLAQSYHDLGNIYFTLNRFRESIAAHERALEMRLRVYGPHHAAVAAIYTNLGAAAFGLGDYAASADYHRKALAIYRDTLPPGSDEVAFAHFNLGGALSEQSKYDEAVAEYEEASRIYAATRGADQPDVADVLADIADVRAAQQRWDEAMDGYARAIAIYEKAPPDQVGGLAAVHLRRAHTHLVRGRYADALADATAAADGMEKAFGKENLDLALALQYVGEAHLASGRPEAALAPLERAQAIRAKLEGPPADVVKTRLRHAQALWATGRNRVEAVAEARRALADAPPHDDKLRAEIEAWLRRTRPSQ